MRAPNGANDDDVANGATGVDGAQSPPCEKLVRETGNAAMSDGKAIGRRSDSDADDSRRGERAAQSALAENAVNDAGVERDATCARGAQSPSGERVRDGERDANRARESNVAHRACDATSPSWEAK
ncbi:hypothetical protein WG70_22945 [Burkholderia oklahomensis EO147]|nr:hypothetical protein WG70_22945 [Burkholderia oklahomensis EO147]KUY68732.1 hypothetical protein WG70_24445 [Burkholderia oklahomensis EO147]